MQLSGLCYFSSVWKRGEDYFDDCLKERDEVRRAEQKKLAFFKVSYGKSI